VGTGAKVVPQTQRMSDFVHRQKSQPPTEQLVEKRLSRCDSLVMQSGAQDLCLMAQHGSQFRLIRVECSAKRLLF
jgi:hypothetical protein